MNNKADELFATATAFQADIIGVNETCRVFIQITTDVIISVVSLFELRHNV